MGTNTHVRADDIGHDAPEPGEGEEGYRCPNCGELYDSKCRTPADRVCFQCRVGTSEGHQ